MDFHFHFTENHAVRRNLQCISIKYSIKLYKGVELKFKYLLKYLPQRDCACSNYTASWMWKCLLNDK